MTIRVIDYDNIIGLESELKYLTDTSFKFYDLGDFIEDLTLSLSTRLIKS